MKLRSLLFFLTPVLSILVLASCSSVSHNNTDLKEYGYNGAVKSIKSTMYYDLILRNDEWVIDDSKIGQIRTVYFNEDGNITKVVTTYPEERNVKETTHFQFEEGRKSGFCVLNAENDTLENAVYKWSSDKDYMFTSVYSTGRELKSWSKLNSDYRDLSGGYTSSGSDSTYYSKSYVNTIGDNNLITQSLNTDDLTKESYVLNVTYSDFDSKKNPRRLEMVEESGKLENLSIRVFEYY